MTPTPGRAGAKRHAEALREKRRNYADMGDEQAACGGTPSAIPPELAVVTQVNASISALAGET